MKKENGTSHPLYRSPGSSDPYPASISTWFLNSTMPCSDSPFSDITSMLPQVCRNPRTLARFRDCVGCASAAELQPPRQILSPGLTERPDKCSPGTLQAFMQNLGISVARDLWIIPIHGSLYILIDPVTRGCGEDELGETPIGGVGQ